MTPGAALPVPGRLYPGLPILFRGKSADLASDPSPTVPALCAPSPLAEPQIPSSSPRSPHLLPSLLRGFSGRQRPELQGLPATVHLAGPARSRVLQASRFGCSCSVLGLMCLLSPLFLRSPAHPFPLSPLPYKELSGSAFSDRMIYPLPVWVPEPRIFLNCVCDPIFEVDAWHFPYSKPPVLLAGQQRQGLWQGS